MPAGGKVHGIVQGLNDVQNGMAQRLYNSLPQSWRSRLDSADHWLYSNTHGVLGIPEGYNLNDAIAQQNQQYESARKAQGREGMDWARGGGGALAQMALTAPSAMTGGALAAAGPVANGMVSGQFLTPVLDPSVANNRAAYELQKTKDTAIGGALGKAFDLGGQFLSGVVKPKISSAAQYLMDQGIPLTPGQILGGMAKSTEDKLASVPVVGDLIKGAQGRGVEGLNTAAYKRVIEPLQEGGFSATVPKQIGREGISSLTDQVKDAYNTIVPRMGFAADQQFNNELASLRAMASQDLEPAQQATFDGIINNKVLNRLTQQGRAGGQTLQGMLSDIGNAATGYMSDPSYANRQLGGALMTLKQHMEDAMSRQNPAIAAQFGKVQQAFANLARIQSAGAMQGAAEGVFSPAQLSAAVKAGDKTVRDNAFAQGRALLQDLSDPAKSILSNTVPNSGTADRAMTAGATGALLAKPQTLLNPAFWGALAPAAMYTKPGQKAAQFLLTQRPAGAGALAKMIEEGSQQLSGPATMGALQMLNNRQAVAQP
jgi:hypothetical protein